MLKENENAMLDNLKQKHAFHGLYRSLVHNMVVGVSEGYKKELELVGVGYRASNNGNIIDFALVVGMCTRKCIKRGTCNQFFFSYRVIRVDSVKSLRLV